MRTSKNQVMPYTTKDGSLVRELMHPAVHGNSNLSLAEAVMEPGSSTDLHLHRNGEEIYHVMRGRGMMTLGAERFTIAAGDTVCILPGLPHRVENTGPEPLKILCCCAPPYSHGDTEIHAEMHEVCLSMNLVWCIQF